MENNSKQELDTELKLLCISVSFNLLMIDLFYKYSLKTAWKNCFILSYKTKE